MRSCWRQTLQLRRGSPAGRASGRSSTWRRGRCGFSTRLSEGGLKIKKIDGSTNAADVLKKYLSAQALTSLLRRLPVTFELGRSSIAAQLQGRSPT